MEKQEKDFILNKGLILGLVLIFFPIIDLVYGLNMSNANYLLIFVIGWMVIYTFLLLIWSKVIISSHDVFPFKDTFRVLFIISSLGFAVLTVGKIALWNVYSPQKYIEINLRRAQNAYNEEIKKISKDLRDCNYDSLSICDDGSCLRIYCTETDVLVVNIDSTNKGEIISKLDFINTFIKPSLDQWKTIKDTGISKTHFIGELIYRLFFFVIYCAILALFVRKKEKFIKTN